MHLRTDEWRDGVDEIGINGGGGNYRQEVVDGGGGH